jgi:hypothetical protein
MVMRKRTGFPSPAVSSITGAESAGLIELRDIALGNPRLVGVYGEDG